MLKRPLHQLKYSMREIVVDIFLSFLAFLSRRLSPESLVSISNLLGKVAFRFLKKYRKRVIQNLSLAFKNEKSPGEVRRLAREVFFHLVLTPLETAYAYANPFEESLARITITGKENLDSALGEKRGVIALGVHLGPFTLVGGRLSLEGYPFNLIINEGNFPNLWKRLAFHQRRLGQNPIPLKPVIVSLKKSLNSLRRNEILYLIADEQQRRGGIPVPFFGQSAFSSPGPAILALKTGAPILPMFIHREDGIQKTLVIGQPLEIERSGNLDKDLLALTAKVTRAIEEIVRQYPGQWTWLNRRWKTSPVTGVLDRTEIEV